MFRCQFLAIVAMPCKTVFRCRFLAIVDVRTIYRYHAMLELQRIRFTGWALTKGQHRPKAGKKKKDLRSGSFFSGSHFVEVVMLHHEGG